MKKIPTLFERDWNGDRSRVVNSVHRSCQWVIDGEGIATRKLDGTCCMIRQGSLYKRREVRVGEAEPPEFERSGFDEETGKTVGWVPCGQGPEDRWHREALDQIKKSRLQWDNRNEFSADLIPAGTYELVGPKVQGNPEDWPFHSLVPHNDAFLVFHEDVPRTFDGLKAWLEGRDIEGIVFHHPDGRMAKIKLRDFGFKRVKI